MSMPSPDSGAGGLDALDWADPSDLPVEEVRDVFLTLSKALRAYQLYDPNNPVYKRFVTNLREELAAIWESRNKFQLLVEEDRFTWLGEEVYRNESRADSLSFMFYRDGIRDITFREGIEGPELDSLLEALHRARNFRGESEDLVTLLWDLDLAWFGYSAIEVGGEGGFSFAGLGEVVDFDPKQILHMEVRGGGEDGVEEGAEEEEEASAAEAGARPVDTVRPEDFNPTLYALDEDDRRYLDQELEKEFARDVRVDVLNALFDRLEERDRPERQVEILAVLRILVPNFLSRGILLPAARVVEEIRSIRERPGVLAEEADRLADELIDDISAPEAVQELVRALEDGSVRPDTSELADLLRFLRPVSLAPLLKGSEDTEHEQVRKILRQAIRGIAEGNRETVIQLLGSRDPSVACGAVRLAGTMKISEASAALVRLLEHGPRQVRKVVVETAAEVPSSVLVSALRSLLRDGDRELRVSAARVLGQTRYAPAARDFRRILEDKDFRQADVTEKVAFFEAYGMLAGEEAVSFLSNVLNSRSFLGRREPPEIRAGAALALGKVGTPGARQALDRALKDDEAVVRSAAVRAMSD